MSTNQPVLRARQSTNSTPSAHPVAASATEALDLEMRWANTVAAAKNALPQDYRQNPGAVLLADQWARRRGIDTLTAMQNVSFVHGRPVVDATFQRAMAKAAGYAVRVEEATTTQAVVAIYEGDELLGRETFTIAEAHEAGLTGKDNWKKFPKNMLVARATTNAIKFYAADVLLGVSLDDELDDDPVATLAAVPDIVADDTPEQSEEVQGAADGEIVEAELVVNDLPTPDGADPAPEWKTDDLKAAIKERGRTQSEALRLAHDLCPDCDSPSTIAQLAAMPETVIEVLHAWDNPPEPERTASQAYEDGEQPF